MANVKEIETTQSGQHQKDYQRRGWEIKVCGDSSQFQSKLAELSAMYDEVRIAHASTNVRGLRSNFFYVKNKKAQQSVETKVAAKAPVKTKAKPKTKAAALKVDKLAALLTNNGFWYDTSDLKAMLESGNTYIELVKKAYGDSRTVPSSVALGKDYKELDKLAKQCGFVLSDIVDYD